jgi:CRP-like cAMP-binding protein
MRPDARTIGHVQRVLFLKKSRFTGTLPASDLALISEYLRERTFASGEVLHVGGEPMAALHFVAEGTVLLQHEGRTMARAIRGAELGGLEMVARAPAQHTAVAETETLTLELTAEANAEMLDDHFGIFHSVLRQTCREIIENNRRLGAEANAINPAPRRAPTPERELDLVERIFFLRQAPPFTRTSINALAELSRAVVEVRFEPGTVLWSEGFSSRGIFLVVSGLVHAASPRFGFEMGVGAGQPLGIVEALAQIPRWYEATVVEPTVVLTGDVESFVDVLEDNFEMAMDYLAVVARWLLALTKLRVAREGSESLEEFGVIPVGSAAFAPGGPA